MRFSNLFGRTLRESQKEADTLSYDLLLRAAYVRPLASGIYTYLHFGQRSMRKIEQILREEINQIGGDEICMPVVHPADHWKKTNRWYDIDDSLLRFKDRTERDMVLAMTHEEVVADLCREVESYKQLPRLVYHIQTKFRDEARPRGGLIRVREFTMKDSYSLDKDQAGLEKQYQNHFNSYLRIFRRVGLPVMVIQSDTGMMGGRMAHEYMYISSIGEDTIFYCENTGYRANKDVATMKKIIVEEAQKPLEKIHTPNLKTIDELSTFLDLEAIHFAKNIFYSAEIENNTIIILALVRGDMEVNTVKLQNLTKCKSLRAATEDEIRSIDAIPGFASPMGVNREKTLIVMDDLLEMSNNLVVGANEEDYHYKNSCYGRDFTADIISDIVSAFDGALCPHGNTNEDVLKSVRGIEVANIFQLGTKYTEALGAFYSDENGYSHPIVMGSYGIGVGRLLACLAQEYNDEFGLALPITVSPYQVILLGLLDDQGVTHTAEKVYNDLVKEGIEVIYDDRPKDLASHGEKFADADLIGIPIRLTISKRSIERGGVEVKLRKEKEPSIGSITDIVTIVKEKIEKMQSSYLNS